MTQGEAATFLLELYGTACFPKHQTKITAEPFSKYSTIQRLYVCPVINSCIAYIEYQPDVTCPLDEESIEAIFYINGLYDTWRAVNKNGAAWARPMESIERLAKVSRAYQGWLFINEIV